MYKQHIVLLFFCINLSVEQQLYKKLNRIAKTQTVYYWKQLQFNFSGVLYSNDTALRWTPESVYFKEDELEEEDVFFKQYNNVPVGFYVVKSRSFMTVPRKRYGIPSTLNYFPLKGKNPKVLMPYPDVDSVPSFVSIYRPRVDDCSRLWVVDTGLLEIPDHHKQLKPPEIIIFDLKTDKEILRYQLKPTDLYNGTTSGLTSITVDVTNKTCDDAYAYINDLATGGLIVFSLRERDSWRFTHPTFNYDTGASFDLRGRTIDWKEGIFSIALSNPDAAGVRTAYYHPFLSTQEFSITTDVLKDKNGDIEANFKVVGIRGPWSQSGIHVYHNGTRNLLFANVAQDGIQCWNVDKPLTPKNVALVASHYKWLAFITDMMINGEFLFFMTNKMDTFVHSALNVSDYNYFTYWAKVKDLIKDTVCEG